MDNSQEEFVTRKKPVVWLRANRDQLRGVIAGSRESKISPSVGSPIATRTGCVEGDESPFYDANAGRLWSYYYSYRSSAEWNNNLLYADLVYLQAQEFDMPSRQISIDNIRVIVAPEIYETPLSLRGHKDKAVECFKQLGKINRDEAGEYENVECVRVRNFLPWGIFTVERACFFDQVGSNLTVDWDSGCLPYDSVTIRSRLECPIDGGLLPFDQSNLANTIGTAIMFYDMNLDCALVRTRSKDMASITEGDLHCTVSGVLEPPLDALPNIEYNFSFFEAGTEHEIFRETHLERSKYILIPVAFGRELPRAGKPQFFFIAILLVDVPEFERCCRLANEADEFVRNADGNYFDIEGIISLNNASTFTYEGYASVLISERFVSQNRERLKHMIRQHLNRTEDGGNP